MRNLLLPYIVIHCCVAFGNVRTVQAQQDISFGKRTANPSQIAPSFRLVPLASAKDNTSDLMWFFSAFLPIRIGNSPFTATSLSFDGVQRISQQRAGYDLSSPLWINIFSGTSNIAQARVGNYDYVRQNPITIASNNSDQDFYPFFSAGKDSTRNEAPVLRRTVGGWAWQRLDTVELDVRRRALFADFGEGKVWNGEAQAVADIKNVKAELDGYQNLIDLGCRVEAGHASGLVGAIAKLSDVPMPQPNEAKGSPLPYQQVWLYDITHQTKTIKLPIIDRETLPFDLKAALPTLGADDAVFFGKPVQDSNTKLVYYWYVVQSRVEPRKQHFVLTAFDGTSALLVDSFKVEWPIIHQWVGGKWQPTTKSWEWEYGTHLHIAVQPIVGKDADGRIICYRPPQFFFIDKNLVK